MLKFRKRRHASRRSLRVRLVFGLMAIAQLALLTAAQLDLWRRPPEAVRGPKWAWRIVTLVNFVGPLSYFACGRREVPAAGAPAPLPDAAG